MIVTRRDEKGRYLNPHPDVRQDDASENLLKWAVTERRQARRRHEARGERLPEAVARPRGALHAATEGLHVTWIGHSSFVLRVDGLTFLLDPVWSDYAGKLGFGPRRLTRPGVAWSDLPKVDALVISHAHYDHLDLETIRRLPRDTPAFCPAGVGALLRGAGFTNVVEREWWARANLGGASLTLVPAQHFSRRGLLDENRTLWGGWVIEHGGHAAYFAGDTGWMETGFHEIGKRFPDLDVALMPIGAYLPRWFMRPVHVDPNEAGEAFLATGARTMVPMHWGTFRLADEAMDQPPDDLRAWAKRRGVDEARIRLPKLGETLEAGARR